MDAIGRRALLGAGLALATRQPGRFALVSPGWRVDVHTELHDRLEDRQLWAVGDWQLRRLCLPSGREACAAPFRGAVAIARFTVQPAPDRLRERLRLLDESEPGLASSQIERSIPLANGTGSSVQAFSGTAGQWCLYRQDLFIGDHRTPFVVLVWKQALAGIRLLDRMPGGEAWTLRN